MRRVLMRATTAGVTLALALVVPGAQAADCAAGVDADMSVRGARSIGAQGACSGPAAAEARGSATADQEIGSDQGVTMFMGAEASVSVPPQSAAAAPTSDFSHDRSGTSSVTHVMLDSDGDGDDDLNLTNPAHAPCPPPEMRTIVLEANCAVHDATNDVIDALPVS